MCSVRNVQDARSRFPTVSSLCAKLTQPTRCSGLVSTTDTRVMSIFSSKSQMRRSDQRISAPQKNVNSSFKSLTKCVSDEIELQTCEMCECNLFTNTCNVRDKRTSLLQLFVPRNQHVATERKQQILVFEAMRQTLNV